MQLTHKRAAVLRSALLIASFIVLTAGTALLPGRLTTASAALRPQANTKPLASEAVQPVSRAVVNFAEVARQEALNPVSGPMMPKAIHSPIVPPEPDVDVKAHAPSEGKEDSSDVVPFVASPATSLNYQALDDIPIVGTSFVVIPPDTHGAVGLDKVMVTLNNNYRVQNKATGATISTVSMEGFWAPTGATGTFDPRTLYDPYNNRWIVTGVSNASSAASSILIGVSQTSDPGGAYHIFRFDSDSTNVSWSDFPCIGFNKNWVAVSVNMFNISNDTFTGGKVLTLNYPSLRMGSTAGAVLFSGNGFTTQPAVTYSPTEETLHMVEHFSSGGGTYRVLVMTGTPGAPVLAFLDGNPGNPSDINFTNPLGGWTQPGGDTLPQAPEVGGTGTRKLEAGNSFIANTVFRNGFIYYAQTIGLPIGRTNLTIDRTAVQWVKLNMIGGFVSGGRVQDSTATPTNGGFWYAYPSITVNKQNDVLLGFSRFSSNTFPTAAYAYRAFNDAAGTMRDPAVLKAGLGYYEKTFTGPRNRFGDYSNTQIDPVNDTDLWMIQEFTALPVGIGNNSGRWGTWWGKINPPCVFSNSKSSKFFFTTGGEDDVNVTATAGCSWTAVSSDPSWLEITSGGGSGNGTVSYLVRDNLTGIPRTGTITIGPYTLNVTQDGGTQDDCTYTIAPLFVSVPAEGIPANSIAITAEERCAWQATTDVAWITIISNCCGVGNGTINYSVAANAGSVGRKGTITVGGRAFTVKQKGA